MRSVSADRIVMKMSDSGLLAIMFLLVGVGLSALFSASYHFGQVVAGNPYHYFQKQMIWVALGIVAALVAYRLPLDLLRRFTPHLLLLTIILNILTYVPGIGSMSGGAQRWIEIKGQTFQPSELVRVVVVLYMAHLMDKKQDRMSEFKNAVLPPAVIAIFMTAIVYYQNDFSSAIYIFFLSGMMLFMGGVRRTHIVGCIVAIFACAIPMVANSPYRVQRVLSWINPLADPSGSGYQLLKARMALENGSLLGLGLGRGEIKLGGLPAAHSDFVFAVVGEETGFLGILCVITLFFGFALKGYSISLRGETAYVRLAAFGLTSSIYFQAFLNMAVVSGALPATGIPLPLFSAGGTSTVVTLGVFGLLLNLSRFTTKVKETICYD